MLGRSRGAEAIRRFRRDQSGATAVEYALIAVLIFLALTAGLSAFGSSAGNMYGQISNRILAALG